MWKDSTFFFWHLYQFLPGKRLRLPLYWDFGTALALWATGFQVLPSSPMERMEGGKHLQQRRWVGWNWWNPVRKQSTCAFFPLENSEFWSQRHDGLFSGVLEAIHMHLFLNGRPHLFHCPSSRGKGRCSQCLVICKRKRSWKSQHMVISIHVFTKTYYTQWDHQRTQICCRRLLLRRRRSLQSKSVWNLVELLLGFS